MIVGARQGKLSVLRRLVASAMAHDLGVFVVPGPEIALVNGLDIEAAGMQIVASPRHASVLLVIGDIPPVLCEAAAVIYAQMMRPRVLFVLGATNGSTDLSPLPVPDIVTGISQQDLIDGVYQLRIDLAKGAFHPEASEFDAPILQIRIEYTCSMHPEIVQDEPGSCPKCGMDLIQREAQASAVHGHTEHKKMQHGDHSDMDHGSDHRMNHETPTEYTCPMHPEVVQNQPGSCPECGMNLEPREKSGNSNHEHHHMEHETQLEYTCPMHPEVVQSEPGSCPKCGMNLESRDVVQVESNHKHHQMDHETQREYTCPMHPEVVENEPGSCPKCGMNLEPRNVVVEYTCPMHPEVVENEPGSCPKCGMNLEPRNVAVEYTCPMHPEVVQNESGSCLKCGMNLEPHHVTVEYTCPMHPEVV
ncbi:MAG: heavy metal-binding domain-containing protein, partial [Thiohalomonadales bacterium]